MHLSERQGVLLEGLRRQIVMEIFETDFQLPNIPGLNRSTYL
jgi:hypothetical protein